MLQQVLVFDHRLVLADGVCQLYVFLLQLLNHLLTFSFCSPYSSKSSAAVRGKCVLDPVEASLWICMQVRSLQAKAHSITSNTTRCDKPHHSTNTIIPPTQPPSISTIKQTAETAHRQYGLHNKAEHAEALPVLCLWHPSQKHASSPPHLHTTTCNHTVAGTATAMPAKQPLPMSKPAKNRPCANTMPPTLAHKPSASLCAGPAANFSAHWQ